MSISLSRSVTQAWMAMMRRLWSSSSAWMRSGTLRPSTESAGPWQTSACQTSLTHSACQRRRIEPRAAARFAMFNYMIGNLDWSVRAGPQGDSCCHNGRLVGGGPLLTPVPYDFDFSGLVDAPYATPPEGFKINSVRQRLYRGYCAHDAEARAANVGGEVLCRVF